MNRENEIFELKELLRAFRSRSQTEAVLPLEWALAKTAVDGKVVIPPFKTRRTYNRLFKWPIRIALLLLVLSVLAEVAI